MLRTADTETYQTLHHQVPLLPHLRDEAENVCLALVVALIQQGVNGDESARPSNASTERSWRSEPAYLQCINTGVLLNSGRTRSLWRKRRRPVVLSGAL